MNADPTGARPSSPHVLIVDDEEPIRSLAACYVEQIGYKVTTVSSPRSCIAANSRADRRAHAEIRRSCPELGSARRSDQSRSHARSTPPALRQARTFKVDEYLAKPLRYGELRDALQRVAPIEAQADKPAAEAVFTPPCPESLVRDDAPAASRLFNSEVLHVSPLFRPGP